MGRPSQAASIRALPMAAEPRFYHEENGVNQPVGPNDDNPRSCRKTALAAHPRGQLAGPCERCANPRHLKRFVECVVLPGQMQFKCTNCHWAESNYGCTWPENDEEEEEGQEDDDDDNEEDDDSYPQTEENATFANLVNYNADPRLHTECYPASNINPQFVTEGDRVDQVTPGTFNLPTPTPVPQVAPKGIIGDQVAPGITRRARFWQTPEYFNSRPSQATRLADIRAHVAQLQRAETKFADERRRAERVLRRLKRQVERAQRPQ